MDNVLKIQIEIQADIYQALKSGDYSLIFEALKRVNQEEEERNAREN